MKPKSTLRSILAMAGSTLITITYASAGTYYWDSNGDGTAGFGSAAGTWRETPDATTNLWSTSPTGDGVGGAAVADYATTTADDLFFGTSYSTSVPPLYPFSGVITIDGTVNAKSIFCSASTPSFLAGTSPVLNFPAEGRFEHATEGTVVFPAMTLTGATTSMTWKAGFIDNLSIENLTNNAAKNIFEGTGSSIFVKGAAELGPVGTPIVFNGGGLRFASSFPYSSMSAFNAAHPITINPNVSIGLAPFGFAFTVDMPLNLGTGGLYISGQNASSPVILTLSENHTGGTFLVAGVAQVSDNAQLGDITSPLVFGSGPSGTGEGGNGTLRITGTTMTSLGARPLVYTPDKGVSFEIIDVANTFTVNQAITSGLGTSATFSKSGPGTLVLGGANTFAGATTVTGGGTLVLDYSAGADSTKLSDTAKLILNNSDLTVKGGTHGEIVLSTDLGAGHSHIARDGGTTTINLNNIVRAAGGSISLGDGTIATTDLANQTAGILGGWATIGNDWAIRSGGTDTLITALGAYTGALPDTGTGSATANYTLTGDQTQSGVDALAAYTVKIEGSGVTNNTLALAGTTLNIQNASATNLGGILYVGGGTGIYNITADATKGINTSATQDLIINTVTGTLNVSAKVNTASSTRALLKTGAGTLVLSSSENAYTGATRVNQGTLLVNGNQASASGAVTVFAKAKIGGTGTIGGTTTINDGGGLIFDIITAAGSHDSLDLAATKALAFPTVASGGNSTLTITSTGGTPESGTYTLVNAPGGITGKLPSVVLPVGWTAGAPYVDGTSLKIDLTIPAPSGYAGWKGANAGGQDPDEDFDNDGVDNGVEYFMNAAAGFTANPTLNGSNTITWSNGGNIPASAYGTGVGKQFVIQTSSDLTNWNDVDAVDLTTNTDGPGGSLTYTLTGASPRFVRLKVTPN